MKLIYKEKDECVEAVKIECTPTEYLVINQAMKKYVDNGEINDIDRDIMRQMLKVEPVIRDQFIKNLFKNIRIYFITAIITEAVIWFFFLR